MAKVFFYCAEFPISEEYVSALPVWRREIFERYRNEKVRQESLAAGLLFSYALSQYGVNASQEPVRILEAGKPVFSARDDLFFSLSHSAGWAACAVDTQPVGVDIQLERPIKDSMLRRFHSAEQSYYFSLPVQSRRHEFFRLWTRKEAWVKAVSDERMLSLAEYDVLACHDTLRFSEFCPDEGIAGAVCLSGTGEPEIIRVDRKMLLSDENLL